MAKYSNLIRLSDFLPVYDILAESPNAWKSFIRPISSVICFVVH